MEGGGVSYIVSSESVAIDVLGFTVERDIAPGECVFISTDRHDLHSSVCHDTPSLNPCIFEYVYLARPDSTIDGIRYILVMYLVLSIYNYYII